MVTRTEAAPLNRNNATYHGREYVTGVTYPHDSEQENTVHEEDDDGRRYVDPVVAVGHHPRTARFRTL